VVLELEQSRIARLQSGGPQARKDVLGFREELGVALELRLAAGTDVDGALVGCLRRRLAQCLLERAGAALGDVEVTAVELGGALVDAGLGEGRLGGRGRGGRGRVEFRGDGPCALPDDGDGLLDAGHRPYGGRYLLDEARLQGS
jgi:hypothetical protein